MKIIENNKENNKNESTVYGPVKSWRFGMSLGVDPIFDTSRCSFNCIYCQLGNICDLTLERKIYVPTERILSDFKNFLNDKKNEKLDVITVSGMGEPTLAKNLGEIARELKTLSNRTPIIILTNSTLLGDPEVMKDLASFDRVIAKLDAFSQESLQTINRPCESIDFDNIVSGLKAFRKFYKGLFDLQLMFTPLNLKFKDKYISILNELSPDTVQINTPTRPYPLSWHRENRGKHSDEREYEIRKLARISSEEAEELKDFFKKQTGLNIISQN